MKNLVLLATHWVHSLPWAHRSVCCFCRATAHMIVILLYDNHMSCCTTKTTNWPSLISLRCPHEEPCTFNYPLSAQSSLGAQLSLLFLSCNSSYDCHIIRPTLKLFLFPFTKPYTTVSKREGSLGWWNIFLFPKEGKWVPKYDKDICIKTNWISVILE